MPLLTQSVRWTTTNGVDDDDDDDESNGVDGGMSASIPANSLRRRVLSSYKLLLRLGNAWTSLEPVDTTEERRYIIEETKSQFRKNKTVVEESEINELLREVEARVEMARHYGNPYPRAINLPPMGLAASLGKNRKLKGQTRLRQHSVPIYVKSSKELD